MAAGPVTPDPTATPIPNIPPIPSAQVSPTPNPLPTKKNGLKGILMMVAVGVVAAALAGGGVYFWQNQKLSNQVTTANADKDALNTQVASLTKQLADAKTASQAATAKSDTEAIQLIVKASCEADATMKSFSVTISTNTGTFAKVANDCRKKTAKTANVDTVILKKADGQWVSVFEGTTVPATTIAKYSIPSSISK